MNYFSKNLKYLRNKMNLSQSKLGELANVNQTTIARWEENKVSPSLDNVYDLAKALKISIADLIGRDMSKENIIDNKTDITLEMFNKSKNILSDDERKEIELIIQKALDKYQNKNK